ncbi:MAG: hypothetical protein ACP5I4_10885 [Oceanipulchritudo sp.]
MPTGLQCRLHQGSITRSDCVIPWEGDADWEVHEETLPDTGKFPGRELLITVRRTGAQLDNASIALTVDMEDWSREHYVLMPAAAYAGNRFESRGIPYPPILDACPDRSLDSPPIITDVPRLNAGHGPSRLIQLSRDCTTPLIGVFDPHRKAAYFILCPQATRFGDTGLEVEESDDRSRARIALRVPGIRPKTRYSFCSTDSVPSPDCGISIPPGLNITLRVRIHHGECADMREFYSLFFRLRKAFTDPENEELSNQLPFSEAWKILEDKYNRENWNPRGGYYHTGAYHLPEMRNKYADWQTGWVGGLQFTLAQLAMGMATTRERALRNIEFALTRLPAPSGYLWGGWSEGKPFGDHFKDPSLPWVMSRKNGDALYFLLKSFDLLKQQDPDWSPPRGWEKTVKGIADAFCNTWEQDGQFGQFLDLENGKVVVGGTASAGVVPAALALASQWFREPRYLKVARQSAEALVGKVAEKGYTTGGPGEILQCPDSESAFGLFESLVVLHEMTGDTEWLPHAEFLAHQCASWCVSYDYPFPPESEFGRLGMRSLGSVWASVQNKHSAPGICTFSGDSLFKLYRATGNRAYLQLLREIAHNITQYLSRADRPIRGFHISDVGNYKTMHDSPPGWMSERVQLSDFSEPTGEIFAGPCWCESSCMLTAWEIPGLYVRPDQGWCIAFDHVAATVTRKDHDGIEVLLSNPTRVHLTLRILSENANDIRKPLRQNALFDAEVVQLAPGTVTMKTFSI